MAEIIVRRCEIFREMGLFAREDLEMKIQFDHPSNMVFINGIPLGERIGEWIEPHPQGLDRNVQVIEVDDRDCSDVLYRQAITGQNDKGDEVPPNSRLVDFTAYED